MRPLCLVALAVCLYASAADDVRLRLFAPAWRGVGEQDPAVVAKRFGILYLRADPAPFHSANPGVKCIIYSLGPYVNKADMQTLKPEALAHNAAGEVVKARDWPNWLIVPDNPKLLDYERALVRKAMSGGYDGLFVDSLGTAPIDSNYLLTRAINPATHQPYTAEQWLEAEIKLVRAAKEALPKGKLLLMNGLGPGTRYWREPEAASPRVLLDQFDGAMSESIWRTAGSPLEQWPSPENWMLDIRMVQDVERRGLLGFWWTKCGSVVGATPKDEEAHQNLVPQWRRFALASYLLAAGPKSYFNFLAGDKKLNDAAQYYPEYDAPLGVARGPMRELGEGVYSRSFSGGLVIVNPTGLPVDGLRPAGADGEFTSAGEGRKLKAPFSIPAHTGWILARD